MMDMPTIQEEVDLASDNDIVASGGISVGVFLQMSAQSRQGD